MPNSLVKAISEQTGKSVSEVEEVWKKLAEEYGSNYKAIVGALKKAFKYHAEMKAEDTNRELTPFNHLKIEKCIITGESVDPYKGKELIKSLEKDKELLETLNLDPEKTYYIYRPLAEVKKALDSYNDVPLTNEHYFVDELTVNKDKWIGGVGSKATLTDNGHVENSVAIWDKHGVALVNESKKEGLSGGYTFNLVVNKGVWNGKPYDFEMKDLTCNHVALVSRARFTPAKLADNASDEPIFKKEKIKMDAEKLLVKLLSANPHLINIGDSDEEEDKDKDKDKEEKAEDKKMRDKRAKDKRARDEDEDEDKGSNKPDKKEEAEDDDDEEDEEEIADKKRGRDKKMRDKKAKDNDDCKAGDSAFENNGHSTARAVDTAAMIQQAVSDNIRAIVRARDLCERAIGKTAFATDAMPEQMFDETLRAKGVEVKGLTPEAKIALIKYIGDTAQTVQKQAPRAIITDSADDDFELINI